MDKLKPCPFCGSEAAEPVFIGNDHTKKRTVTIKCKAPGCTKGVTVGALRFSHKWCHEEAVKKWNTRDTDTALAAAEARIAELEAEYTATIEASARQAKTITDQQKRIAALEEALERIKARCDAYVDADAPMNPDSSVQVISDICAAALLKDK